MTKNKIKAYIKRKGETYVSYKFVEKILTQIENQPKAKTERRVTESKKYIEGINRGFEFCIEQIRQEIEY